MTRRTRRILTDTGSYIVMVIFSLIVLLPLAWMVITSLKSIEEVTLISNDTLLPSTPAWSNYLSIWQNYPMLSYLKNSLVSVGGSTIIVIIFATLCGYGAARFEFKGKGALLGFLLVSQMFPAVMKIIPYYKTLKNLGMVNTLGGLLIVYASFSIPFCTWMMYGYFRTIPKELDEAAEIDGAGPFRAFFSIVMPLTLPGLMATTIYAFLQNWNEYMFASILMSGEANKTLTVGIANMAGYYRILWNDLMCGAVVSSVPTLLVFLFMQKYLISGMAAGAVKG